MHSRVHHANLLKDEWAALDIVPVWNVAYRYEYMAGIEMYWGQLKARFRPILLQKMLAWPGPRSKDTPLKDAVWEAICEVPHTSIP